MPYLKHSWSLRALCVPGLYGEEIQGGASCSDLVCKKPSKETILEASARSKFYLFIFLQMCLHVQMHVYRCMGSCMKDLSPESKGEPPVCVHTAPVHEQLAATKRSLCPWWCAWCWGSLH